MTKHAITAASAQQLLSQVEDIEAELGVDLDIGWGKDHGTGRWWIYDQTATTDLTFRELVAAVQARIDR
jgi:hypothetical protein